MKITLESISNSAFGVWCALTAGQLVPSALGHRIAGYIARRIVSKPERLIVQVMRANQWVISGESLSADELDSRALHVMQSNARCLFDYYHYFTRPEDVKRLVRFSPQMQAVFNEYKDGKKSAIFIAPHISAFDLAMAAFSIHGLKFQALSYPKVNEGYAWQNQLRRKLGMEVTPLNMVALQQARERLQKGGMVLSGLDRPNPDSKYKPRFFGRPAALPVFHVKLALRTNSPVIVAAIFTQPDGTYLFDCHEPMWMEPHPDPHIEIIQNAEKLLKVGETFIRNAPEQWAMFYPVWPEVMKDVPKSKI